MPLSPKDAGQHTREICSLAPVMPVIVINESTHAVPLANALLTGGLPALEVTLRTPAALDAIQAMSQIKGAIVGAGTLITPEDVRAAKQAGAVFGVSPGATDALLSACETEGLPLLPGAATASEAMRLLERGYDMQKFFPAEASGGVQALKSIAGPLPRISFCPTGGINTDNARTYLAQDNVLCVGGSWITPADLLERGKWSDIQALAHAACALA